ncbi:MAG TPA: thioredoxin family protein [Smithellaceae bacterium]|jgi:thioredoxin 1|nr:thioredoxin family protein [Alphaproteobacteria bacterium]HPK54455.1 thioredoxin family protein [Smithellaceae bacterium]
MKVRLKLIGIFVLLAAFSFTFPSLHNSQAFAQDKNVTAAAAKETNQYAAKSDTILATFIEIGAARCIPCKAMQPIMKEVAEKYKGQVKVIFHDVWTPQGKIDGMKYNIRVIPTQVFLDKNGKEYFRHEGYFPKEELIKVLKMQGVK